ncbi:MAG TPA: hypothetical protein DCY20_11205 [Firmicutes bacterium]|nr:hypothetical protein [Bacillota bacterium]
MTVNNTHFVERVNTLPSQYLGTAIRELRKKKNMTLEQLADGICSKRQLQRIETNQTMPSAALLVKLSTKLNEHIDDLYTFSGCKDPMAAYALSLKLHSLYNYGQYEEMHKTCRLFLEENPDLPTQVHQIIGYCIGYSAFQSASIDNPDITYYEELLRLTLPPMSIEDMCQGYKTTNEVRILSILISQIYFDPIKRGQPHSGVEYYKKGLSLFDSLLGNYLLNYTSYESPLLLDLYMGCSFMSYLASDYTLALDYCNKGIIHCLSQCSPLHLATAYGLKSEIFIALGDELEANVNNEYYELLHNLCDSSHISKEKTKYFKEYFTF